MALDPDTKAVLDQMAAMKLPDFHELSPQQAREFSLAPPPDSPTPVQAVEDQTFTYQDNKIGVRIYRSSNATDNPALVYCHGGGWVIGNLDSHDETCRQLCSDAGVTVVSVDYRLAPETPFPGPVEDCYAAVQWVAENATQLGINAERIAVGGDSAGGNLAAAVALMCRDRKSVDVKFQLLFYPVTQADFETRSYVDNAEGYFLTRESMKWFWDHYVPDATDRTQAYAAPMQAASLQGLPPALVQTAEYDPLRDEGEAYAQALRAANVTTQMTRYNGLVHGFIGMQANVAAARPAMAEAVAALKANLA